MNTSENTRLIIVAALFVLVCVIVLANLLLAARFLARQKVGRRGAIIWSSLLIFCVLCAIDAFYWEPNWVQVTWHTIKTPKLSASSSVRIVQLTDFHINGDLTRREIRAARAVKSVHPDVVVLTGDYTIPKNSTTLSALARLARMFSDVAPTYAVEGNWDSPEDIIALRKGGAKFLSRWTRIRCRGGGGIALGRAEWYGGETRPIPASCRGLYTVVLCHMPRHFKQLGRRGVDLVLAGHTHGGQVRLPVIGALLPERRLVGRYQMGFYRSGKALMYVNRGLGCEGLGAPEIRFYCRPEVAVFDIVGTGGDNQ